MIRQRWWRPLVQPDDQSHGSDGGQVSITRAEYDSTKKVLRIEASSTQANATLQVYVTSTSALVGTLSNNGVGKLSKRFAWSVNPQNITIRSSGGGRKSAIVVAK